jgi:hypothetical protein
MAARHLRAARRTELGIGDDQRHMDGFLVGGVPFLVHPAVRTEHVAVIRGQDDDGIVEERRTAQPFVDGADVRIHLLLQVVVALAVDRQGWLRQQEVAIFVGVDLLRRRLLGEVLVARRGVRHLRHRVVGEGKAETQPEQTEEDDVVRIDK